MATDKYTRQVDMLRIKILYRQSRAAQAVGLINLLVYSYLCMEVFGKQVFWLIVACGVLIALARHLVRGRFRLLCDRDDADFDPKPWENRFAFGAIVTGVPWGLAGALLPKDAIMQQAFLAFVLAGTTAGATVSYCVSYRVILAFVTVALVPFAMNMLLAGTSIQFGMGIMLFFYVGLLALMTRNLSRHVVDSIRLRFEKDQALEDLAAARNSFAHSTKMAALGEMAGGIAHEINNPLAIIRANAGVIHRQLRAEEIDRKKVADIADKIDTTVDRIAKIVAGLRTFSREAGNDPLEDVSAREMIEQTLEFCEARFRSRGLPLEVELPEGDITINCRRVQISQVLLNLLNNAYDAVKDKQGAWVRVRGSIEDGQATISVCDSGTGISTELREKIMQPFFTTKKVGEGTGLGLSIAHGIMEGHGGSLKLDTKSENTRFVMAFGKGAPARGGGLTLMSA